MRSFIFIFFILVSHILDAQVYRVDSLLNVLKNLPEDSSRVETIDRLFLAYLNNDIKKAWDYATLELDLARKIHFQRGISLGLMNKGILAQQEGDYPRALKYFLATLKLNEQINYNLTNTYINVANIYTEQQDYKKAIDYNFKALHRIRFEKDSTMPDVARSLPVIYNNLGSEYFYLGDYQRSLEYGFAGLTTARRLGDKISMSVASNNIGVNYFNLANYDKAREYYTAALQYGTEENSLLDIADANINLGALYSRKGDYQTALMYFDDALKTTFLSGFRPQRLSIYQNQVECYNGLKDYKSKADHLEKYIALKDSIFNEEKSAQLAWMRTEYETEEKERENIILANKNQIQLLELNKKNYLMFGLALAILIVMLIAWLLLRQNKVRSEQRALQLEQKLLRSQMNPHFIFNSLATIESFIYENEPKEAGRYLSDFARLMRLILENSTEEYITLEKEVKTLDYYLILQRLRLDNKLDYVIHIDEELDPGEILIPPMLTQPFIENAIEHGFRGSKESGKINIAFRKQDKQMLVEVIDNGIGISNALKNEKAGTKHRSMAMQITKERLAVLNKSKRQKMTFSVSDISNDQRDGTGTKVEFTIPII